MAAIIQSQPARAPHDRGPARPELTVVPGPSRRMQGVYRRRRIVAALVAFTLVLALSAVGRTVAGAIAPAPPGNSAPIVDESAASDVVVVQPGDTLWAIARRLQPDGDVRPLVDRLAAAHGPGPLLAGERLPVPEGNG